MERENKQLKQRLVNLQTLVTRSTETNTTGQSPQARVSGLYLRVDRLESQQKLILQKQANRVQPRKFNKLQRRVVAVESQLKELNVRSFSCLAQQNATVAGKVDLLLVLPLLRLLLLFLLVHLLLLLRYSVTDA